MDATQISNALASIAAQWDPDSFENGDCHTLAMALHQASAPADTPEKRLGSLWACIRKEIDEDGVCSETCYTHMVYSQEDGTCWDINGPEADTRWADRYDLDSRDKWGRRTELAWEEVPCQHAEYCDTHVWLQEHYGTIDTLLRLALLKEIREVHTTA